MALNAVEVTQPVVGEVHDDFEDCEGASAHDSDVESFHSFRSEANEADAAHMSSIPTTSQTTAPFTEDSLHDKASSSPGPPASYNSDADCLSPGASPQRTPSADDAEQVMQPELGDIEQAEATKQRGNELFKERDFEAALAQYKQALEVAPVSAPERAIYYGNCGACYVALEQYAECVHACTEALLIDATYMKALRRRMAALEHEDQLDKALEDAKKILEACPGDDATRAKVHKWEPIVRERQEKMKEEMLGKLKDLGNNVLGRFGMSLDNFKMVQDPNSGGYSISFQQ